MHKFTAVDIREAGREGIGDLQMDSHLPLVHRYSPERCLEMQLGGRVGWVDGHQDGQKKGETMKRTGLISLSKLNEMQSVSKSLMNMGADPCPSGGCWVWGFHSRSSLMASEFDAYDSSAFNDLRVSLVTELRTHPLDI